ncbi:MULTISPECIES: hypothetical protein [unclassified Streptomyces]|uniref:hypothetical protein n=1 Tax=unclassified Streptomyces TaxID=2593676 RepID=UPI001161249A|nr:hypothetical protein [Streptomyces sp. CB02058]
MGALLPPELVVATALGCFSRKVVGWTIADHMRTDLGADARKMAARTRGSLDGAVSTPTTKPNTRPRPSPTPVTSSK